LTEDIRTRQKADDETRCEKVEKTHTTEFGLQGNRMMHTGLAAGGTTTCHTAGKGCGPCCACAHMLGYPSSALAKSHILASRVETVQKDTLTHTSTIFTVMGKRGEIQTLRSGVCVTKRWRLPSQHIVHAKRSTRVAHQPPPHTHPKQTDDYYRTNTRTSFSHPSLSLSKSQWTVL
jgi:hypothetical protein